MRESVLRTESGGGTAPPAPASPRCRDRHRPALVYLPSVVALAAAALHRAARPAGVALALAAAGLLSWGLFEYVVHRFVLHRDRPLLGVRLPGSRAHAAHHRDPRSLDRLHVPIREGLPVAAGYVALTWALTGHWYDMAWLYAGFMVGYLYYEWLDLQAHHGAPRLAPFRRARAYHLQHHHVDPAARYGVTSPLFDRLFGTFRLDPRRPGRATPQRDDGRDPRRAIPGEAS